MEQKTQQEFMVGALIGGLVGAAAALLFTPVSGSKLRGQLNGGFGYFEEPKPKKRKAKNAAVNPVKKAAKAARTVKAKASTLVKKAEKKVKGKVAAKPRKKRDKKTAPSHAAHAH